jgi:hypothetical protein
MPRLTQREDAGVSRELVGGFAYDGFERSGGNLGFNLGPDSLS